MLSFYQKLATKLNEGSGSSGTVDAKPAQGSMSPASHSSASLPSNKTNPKQPQDSEEPSATEDLPEGAEPLEVDLFQSESRMVLFVQMSGVSPDDFEITTDEEANVLVIQATQKRPELPAVAIIPGSEAPAEKGRFVKQEVKWKLLYRKVYLPAPFLGSEAQAIFVKGVLVVTLPAKRLGIGKKLVVKEIIDEKKPA